MRRSGLLVLAEITLPFQQLQAECLQGKADLIKALRVDQCGLACCTQLIEEVATLHIVEGRRSGGTRLRIRALRSRRPGNALRNGW